MKGTDEFKRVIQLHLDTKAETDLIFAECLTKEGRNIDDCITYIMDKVQKSGCNGFADSEIFGMAEEYWTKETIEKIDKKPNYNVVVNHKVEKKEAEAPAPPAKKEKTPKKGKANMKVIVNKDKAPEAPKIFQPSLF